MGHELYKAKHWKDLWPSMNSGKEPAGFHLKGHTELEEARVNGSYVPLYFLLSQQAAGWRSLNRQLQPERESFWHLCNEIVSCIFASLRHIFTIQLHSPFCFDCEEAPEDSGSVVCYMLPTNNHKISVNSSSNAHLDVKLHIWKIAACISVWESCSTGTAQTQHTFSWRGVPRASHILQRGTKPDSDWCPNGDSPLLALLSETELEEFLSLTFLF